MKALDFSRQARRARRRRARSHDRGAHRRDRADDDDGALRLGPPPVRGPRPVHRGGVDPRPRADGDRRGGRLRGHRAGARRPGRDAVPDRLRQLLHVRPGSSDAVRDHAGARGGNGGDAVRLHEAVRLARTAARRSTCAFRRRTTATSRCRRARPTSASSTSRTCCRPPGRRWSTPAIPDGGSVTILGLGPIGDMAARIAMHHGHRVIGVDLVPERLERVQRRAAPRCSTCASTTTTSPR